MFARPSAAGNFVFDDVAMSCRGLVELGWEKSIKFDRHFVGRGTLEEEVAQPRRKMVTLVWIGEDVIVVFASMFRNGEPQEPLEMSRDLLGCVCVEAAHRASTSRCYRHFFQRMLALRTIDVRCSAPGTDVAVASNPYKIDNRRIDVANLSALPGR